MQLKRQCYPDSGPKVLYFPALDPQHHRSIEQQLSHSVILRSFYVRRFGALVLQMDVLSFFEIFFVEQLSKE